MRFFIKKILVVISILLFSLGIVWGAWAWGDKTGRDSYQASEETSFKVASPENREAGKTFENWERTLIERGGPITRDYNYTQEIARQVTAEFLRAKAESAEEIDEEKLVEQALAQSLPKTQELDYREYKISELKLTTDNSPEAFKNYGNRLGEASNSNVYDVSSGTEAEILFRAIQLNREKEFEKLKPIIENYENLIADTLKIEVPTELASTHLNITNSLSRIKSGVEEFKVFLKDPVRGLFIMSSYASYSLDLQDYVREIDSLMKDKGIIFKETEPGFSIEKIANFSPESLQSQ